ncbi:hypothetical protein D3C71_1552080 [compost metagenome]
MATMTDQVDLSFSTIKGQKKSCQTLFIVSIVIVAITGPLSGRIILIKMPMVLAPSILAASSSASGMVSKKFLKIRITTGFTAAINHIGQ